MEDKKIRLGAAEASEPLGAGVTCPACGYDLRGCVSDRCSECGRDLADVRSGRSLLPWADRRRLGCFKAFWKTVLLVSFRPRVLYDERKRRHDPADERRFRWLVMLHAYTPAFVVSLTWLGCGMAAGRSVSTAALLLLAAANFAIAASSVVMRDAFCMQFPAKRLSPEFQMRLAAVASYAYAPLAFVPLLSVVFVGLVSAFEDYGHVLFFSLMAGTGLGCMGGFLWLSFVMGSLVRGRRRRPSRLSRQWRRATANAVVIGGIFFFPVSLVILAVIYYSLFS